MTIIYTLTLHRYNFIIRRAAQQLAEGKLSLFPDYGKKLRCRKCHKELTVGSRVVSKPFGVTYRIYYCVPCGRRLKII